MGSVLLTLPLIFSYTGEWDDIRTPKIVAMFLFAAFVGANLVCIHISLSLGVALFGAALSAAYSGFSPLYQFNFLGCVVAAITVSYLAVNLNKQKIKTVLLFMIAAAIINAAMAYAQMAGFELVFHYIRPENAKFPVGFMGQQTLLGPFLSASIIASLFLEQYVIAIFLLFPCVATNSSFTFAGLGVGVTFWVFCRGWRKTAILVALCGAAFVARLFFRHADYELVNDNGRFENWGYIFWEAMKRPWIGHGFGTYEAYAEGKASGYENGIFPHVNLERFGIYRQAHNDYLELFFNMGLSGLTLAAWMLIDFVRAVIRNVNNMYVMAAAGILIVFLIDALGNFPFRLVPHGLVALVAWVIVCTYRGGNRDSYT